MAFYNRVYCSTATTGTGTITTGSAVDNSFLSFLTALGGNPINNGTTVTYKLLEGTDFEIGRGVYSSGTLTRAVVLISKIAGVVGTTKMTLAGNATVQITAAAEDLVYTTGTNTLAGALTITDSSAATGLGSGALVVSVGGASIAGNTYVGGNLVVSSVITATAKAQNIGAAGGNPATGSLVPGDANILGYNSGSGNWSGWGVDNNGFFWIRTGTSGTGAAPFYLDTSGNCFFLGSALSKSPTGGMGYTTGAGGTVAQATSKSTGVTLNKVSGQITMIGLALAASTTVSFVLTNSAIAATDTVAVQVVSGTATVGTYQVWPEKCTAGTVTINVRNISGGSLSESIVLQFNVNKGVTS